MSLTYDSRQELAFALTLALVMVPAILMFIFVPMMIKDTLLLGLLVAVLISVWLSATVTSLFFAAGFENLERYSI